MGKGWGGGLPRSPVGKKHHLTGRAPVKATEITATRTHALTQEQRGICEEPSAQIENRKRRFLPCFCAGTTGLLSLLVAAPEHTPRPSSRACRGRLSPGRCWQDKPEPQRAVYTPHACPSPRAHVMQQPQPGSLTRSAHSFGSGLHCSSAPASHGSQRTTGPTVPTRRASAASAARQSIQRPGIVPIELVTK